MTVRKLRNSWQYDIQISGYGRHRKGGFRTKSEALVAERRARQDLLEGRRRMTLADAYEAYMAATSMRIQSRETNAHIWLRVQPSLGHLYVEEVTTSTLDVFKRGLPTRYGPATVNRYLEVIRSVLRFCWKRGHLASVPYVPMQSVPQTNPQWYSELERDRLFAGMFDLQPQWYLFFYLSARLGLRLGEVYAVAKSRIRDIPAQLSIDRAFQRGTKTRLAVLGARKNNRVLTLSLSDDIVSAIRWHIAQGYAGEDFLFFKGEHPPRYLDSHKRPLRTVQRKLGLRELSHHKLGRHSVASQAVTGGHSMKTIQAQLGHQSEQSTHMYAHLGDGAQLRLVQDLEPKNPPHVNVASTTRQPK